MIRSSFVGIASLFTLATACAYQTVEFDAAPTVAASVETTPVGSVDDAADDPAIWVHEANAINSRILGTDKQAGLYVYNLDGAVVQFLPVGRLNNVDLRQDAKIGDRVGDFAAASNRTDDTIALFSIAEDGAVELMGSFSSILPEPYGLCVGAPEGVFTVFVAHKTGDLVAYRVDRPDSARVRARLKFASQLEGCAFDEPTSTLFIGEENRGVWRAPLGETAFSDPTLLDEIGRDGGLVADVEGLAIRRADQGDYLIASSQGDNSFVIYALETGAPLTKFRIAADGAIGGVEETDGIDVVSLPMGPAFPEGFLIVQDGVDNTGDGNQNYKLVDWRRIRALLPHEQTAP